MSPDQVPAHVLDALEEDLGRVEGVEPAVPTTVPASPRAIQDRWQRVPSTEIASSDSVDFTNAVQVFPMLDGASEEVERRFQGGRRVVLVPGSVNGTPRSNIDRSMSIEWMAADDVHSQSTLSVQERIGQESGSSDTESLGGVSDVSLTEVRSEAEPDPVVEEASISPACRAALRWLDTVDLTAIFSRRAAVMRSVPQFLCGAFRAAMRLALQERGRS